MTDRVNSLCVVFKDDIRIDDVKHIINAIKLIKGVINVEPNITDIEAHVSEQRALNCYREKLFDVLYPK